VPSAPARPPDERERLEALRELRVLDTPPEERFDRIARLAARVFGAPIAMVSLVDAERQWMKACVGFSGSEMPRETGVCGHTILGDGPLVVTDLGADPRFAGNPLVTGGPGLRFYAGEPLSAPSGHKVGTLCVLGREPRDADATELGLLSDLARLAEAELANVELARALAAQSENEELLRTILVGTVEGIVGLDRDGRIFFVNKAAERMLGWSQEQMVGEQAHGLYHHSHADGSPFPWLECPIRRAITHAEVVHLDDVFWRRDGASFPCESLTAPLRRDGEVIGAVSSFINVSERREVDRMKDEFASVVGHELRTPLTSIRASLGLLGGGVLGELGPDAAGLLDTAVANADRLERLIDDILDLERLEAGVAPLEPSPQSVGELIRDATAVIAAMAAMAGVNIHAEAASGEVLADRDRIVQALTNLLGNAIKFSPRGGNVTLSARRDGDEVVLCVADEGRGIPPERHAAIFERFEQVDASDARARGGTGLGLTIARRIVEAHGGRIWVTSAPGEGSQFAFTLPAVAT
jgi:PAS domain S-box-containing protein